MAIQTELTDNLAYGVDLKARRVYFGVNLDAHSPEEATDFTMASVEYVIRAIHRMSTEAPNKPISLHMCSNGGDPYAMLRLVDEIQSCPSQIIFYGGGMIASCATWIMCVCDERYLMPNTTIMVHDGSDGFEGKHTDVQISAAEAKRLQDRLYDIYAHNTKMNRAFWVDVCSRDLYLTAEEAIQLGMADKLIEPKKRGNLRKVRQAALKKQSSVSESKALLKSIYTRINKTNIPKIEFNEIAKEPVDPNVVIAENEKPQPTGESTGATQDKANP